jgi:3-deoxy-D-manno-octulosonate 8-phosphate phosphatase (KDO 8-P phosphatase)
MPERAGSVAERCRAIELLVVDVDGVLTDGGIIYGDGGLELKKFHVRDGSGLKLWRRAGKQAAILTGRSTLVVDRRAAELDIAHVVQGVADKLTGFARLLAVTGVQPAQTCIIGDDVPDLAVMRSCGLAVAVADACPEAREEAQYITRAPGGRGAVREAIELILSCQGRWQELIAAYRNQSLATTRTPEIGT